jgi:hypothetical protein
MMSEQNRNPTISKTQLGRILGQKMRDRGVSVGQAAEALQCSEAAIRTYLRGRSAPRPSDLNILTSLLELSAEEREDLEHLRREASKRTRTPWGWVIPPRLKKFFNLEQTAQTIKYWHPSLPYGLAQDPSFARMVLAAGGRVTSGKELDALLQVRLDRQKRLFGAQAPRLAMIYSEAVTLDNQGGAEVRKAQLRHFVHLAKNGIEVRIIPFDHEQYLPAAFPFVIFEADGQEPVVYLENLTDGIFVDDEDRVRQYQVAFEQLLTAALSVEDTIDLLASVVSEL